MCHLFSGTLSLFTILLPTPSFPPPSCPVPEEVPWQPFTAQRLMGIGSGGRGNDNPPKISEGEIIYESRDTKHIYALSRPHKAGGTDYKLETTRQGGRVLIIILARARRASVEISILISVPGLIFIIQSARGAGGSLSERAGDYERL